MGRLIDADKLKQHYSWWGGLIGDDYVSELVEQKKVFDTIVDVQPTVDAVPVVRCDDCIYRDGKTPGQPNILCWQMHVDDFCSYGTKREVGTYCEDIVSVVRCKDCIYYHKGDWYDDDVCKVHSNDDRGYCAWGERK